MHFKMPLIKWRPLCSGAFVETWSIQQLVPIMGCRLAHICIYVRVCVSGTLWIRTKGHLMYPQYKLQPFWAMLRENKVRLFIGDPREILYPCVSLGVFVKICHGRFSPVTYSEHVLSHWDRTTLKHTINRHMGPKDCNDTCDLQRCCLMT